MKKMNKKERMKALYSLLDNSIETYEERLNVVEPLLETYTYPKGLEAITNYLLWSKDIDRGAKLEYKIYDSSRRLSQKHYKSSSLDEKLENGEVELEELKRNYKLDIKLKYEDLDIDKLKSNCENVEDNKKLLKYIEDNNIDIVKRAREYYDYSNDVYGKKAIKGGKKAIKDDMIYIGDRNTIRFKAPIKDGAREIDLDSFIYTNEIMEKFIGMSIEKEVDMTTSLGVLRYMILKLHLIRLRR